MAHKSSRKSPALVSTLVSAEHAAEEEILETPAVSSLSRAADNSDNSDNDDDDDDDADQEAEEAEIERRLVEEKLAEEQSKANERENRGIYNGDALKKLVADYAASTASLAWVETLDVYAHAIELTSVHDDLKREVAFYNNTLASVRSAKDKLKQQNVAYKRPLDYFAEMLKSDAHMAKVKDKLIYEQKKIHAVDERKKSQAHRKVAKEVQAEKAKERLQQKKDTLTAVKEWKKRRNADKGGAIRDDDDRELDDIVAGKTPVAPTGGKRKRTGGNDDRDAKKPRVNFKRDAKNKKFGFGGPKKFSKSNTRESTNDTSSFPGRRQRGGAPSSKGGAPSGKGGVSGKGNRSAGGKAPKGKRPSKTVRTKQRGGKR